MARAQKCPGTTADQRRVLPATGVFCCSADGSFPTCCAARPRRRPPRLWSASCSPVKPRWPCSRSASASHFSFTSNVRSSPPAVLPVAGHASQGVCQTRRCAAFRNHSSALSNEAAGWRVTTAPCAGMSSSPATTCLPTRRFTRIDLAACRNLLIYLKAAGTVEGARPAAFRAQGARLAAARQQRGRRAVRQAGVHDHRPLRTSSAASSRRSCRATPMQCQGARSRSPAAPSPPAGRSPRAARKSSKPNCWRRASGCGNGRRAAEQPRWIDPRQRGTDGPRTRNCRAPTRNCSRSRRPLFAQHRTRAQEHPANWPISTATTTACSPAPRSAPCFSIPRSVSVACWPASATIWRCGHRTTTGRSPRSPTG